MAQTDTLKRYLETGMAVTQLTRARAESIVKDLVKAGEVRRDRTQEAVDELVDRSRRNTEALLAVVRKEITSQLSQLGLATKDDLARLERKLTARSGSSTRAPAKKAAAKKA
jgi:polyhydroxyalkanoate synthesis regulator phasin